MRKYLILFLLITAKGFCQNNLDKALTTAEYTIKYSSDWLLDETKRNGAEFFLFRSPVPGKFGNNINLLVQDLKGMNMNLDTYTKTSEDQINANGNLIKSQRKTANAREYQELIFTAAYNGFEVKFLQYYFIKEDKAYVLTFTALETEFESLSPEAATIMNTFRL